MPHDTLVFDVLGTMVDEHGSIRDELAALVGAAADPDALERTWAERFAAALERIRTGDEPYATTDALNLRVATSVVADAGLDLPVAAVEHLGRIGHRLRAWPDSAAALTRLAEAHTVVALSNGNRAMLANMHATAGLRWHLVVPGEEVGAYKPDPSVYRRAARALGRAPRDLTMVAAHPWDLRGAAAVGMRTAYVRRPGEGQPLADDAFDLVADDLDELYQVLGSG